MLNANNMGTAWNVPSDLQNGKPIRYNKGLNCRLGAFHAYITNICIRRALREERPPPVSLRVSYWGPTRSYLRGVPRQVRYVPPTSTGARCGVTFCVRHIKHLSRQALLKGPLGDSIPPFRGIHCVRGLPNLGLHWYKRLELFCKLHIFLYIDLCDSTARSISTGVNGRSSPPVGCGRP